MEKNEENGPSFPKKIKLESSEKREITIDEEKDEDRTFCELMDQDTEPYDDNASATSHEFNFPDSLSPTIKDSASPVLEDVKTPEIELKDLGEQESCIRPELTRIQSVLRDAKLIANIVTGVDVSEVYEKLKCRRKDPSRVDIVTNQILEDLDKQKKNHISTGTQKGLLEDFVTVIDKAMANIPNLPLTADEINKLLEEHQNRPDRVDYVVSQILIKHYKRPQQQKEEYIEVMMRVLAEVPGADPQEVYLLVESNHRNENVVKKVVEILQSRAGTSDAGSKSDSAADQKYAEDPLFRDMQIVIKVLPEKDPNEVYEYLAAHHEKKDRIRVVIEELMKAGEGESESLEPSLHGKSASFMDVSSAGRNGIIPKNIQDEVDELLEIFPDCDPNYLYDELENRKDDQERVRNLALQMFELKTYPKLKETLEERKKQANRKKIQNLEFDITHFLSKFPDPMDTFLNDEKKMSDSYKEHSFQQLRRDYRHVKKSYLETILENHNYHYTSSKKQIVEELANAPVRSKRFRRKELSLSDLAMPAEPDEYFFHEKLFYEHEEEIRRHLKEKQQQYELRLQEARKNGELMECQCCYDDECLFENMSACAEGHLFCKDCIRRSSEVVVGQDKTEFPCLTGTCPEKFSLSVLQNVLPGNMFSIVLRKMQEEEIKMADIRDLVCCPFCSFATIMPDENDKVFRCLNPECLKESCRLCKEPNHIPLRCDEVEKQGETNMRTFIEARLTEAMIRRCHKCKKAFVKEFGCNKMTCTCGATSCYVCRAKDIDYDHFNTERCNEGDMNKLHREEMLRAATAARDKYLEDHPDAREINLKYDPIKHVEEFRSMKAFGDDDDNGEEDYDEDDDDYDD